jgi:hypothetical protein
MITSETPKKFHRELDGCPPDDEIGFLNPADGPGGSADAMITSKTPKKFHCELYGCPPDGEIGFLNPADGPGRSAHSVKNHL